MLAVAYHRSRWLAPARGVAAGALALLLIASWPHLSLARLALLFGAYALAEGSLLVVGASFTSRSHAEGKLTQIQGLAGIAIGLIVFGHPGINAANLMLQIALRAATIGGVDGIVGMAGMAGLVALRQTRGAGLLLLNAAVPALVEAFIVIRLGIDALAAQWLLAISAIAGAALFIALALRLWACAGR